MHTPSAVKHWTLEEVHNLPDDGNRYELGLVYHPRAVMRFAGSEVEPELMVRALHPGNRPDWDDAPIPILIVEILSLSTRRRDQVKKRSL